MTEQNIDEGLGKALGALGSVAGKAAGAAGKIIKDKTIEKTSGRVNVKAQQSQNEEVEVVCDFLLDNGYASTGVEAENIYEHMSDEWKEYILNS